MKNNALCALFAYALGASLLAGCYFGPVAAQAGDFVYRVGFVNIADSDPNCFAAQENFKKAINSAEFKAKVGTDKVMAITADSDLNVEKQTTNVENMLTRGVDALFIIGVDTEGNTTSVEQCNAENVPVFMVGTEASGGNWKFIGFNEVELGKKQGEWCAKNLPQNTNICYLSGKPGREAAVMREAGFVEGLSSRKDLKVISSQTGEFNTARGMQVTEDWIQTFGDKIGCIVSADSLMIGGAIEALKAAKMIDKAVTCGVVHLGTWDADPIREGTEDYAVYVGWPDIGTLCADVAADIYLGKDIGERTYIKLHDITPANYTDYFAK